MLLRHIAGLAFALTILAFNAWQLRRAYDSGNRLAMVMPLLYVAWWVGWTLYLEVLH